MFFDEARRRQYVIVGEDDALPARRADADVSTFGKAAIFLVDDDEGTARTRARCFDHRRSLVG